MQKLSCCNNIYILLKQKVMGQMNPLGIAQKLFNKYDNSFTTGSLQFTNTVLVNQALTYKDVKVFIQNQQFMLRVYRIYECSKKLKSIIPTTHVPNQNPPHIFTPQINHIIKKWHYKINQFGQNFNNSQFEADNPSSPILSRQQLLAGISEYNPGSQKYYLPHRSILARKHETSQEQLKCFKQQISLMLKNLNHSMVRSNWIESEIKEVSPIKQKVSVVKIDTKFKIIKFSKSKILRRGQQTRKVAKPNKQTPLISEKGINKLSIVSFHKNKSQSTQILPKVQKQTKNHLITQNLRWRSSTNFFQSKQPVNLQLSPSRKARPKNDQVIKIKDNLIVKGGPKSKKYNSSRNNRIMDHQLFNDHQFQLSNPSNTQRLRIKL